MCAETQTVTVKNWRKSKCPAIGDVLEAWWCHHTMKHHVASYKLELHTPTGKEEQDLLLSKKNTLRNGMMTFLFIIIYLSVYAQRQILME